MRCPCRSGTRSMARWSGDALKGGCLAALPGCGRLKACSTYGRRGFPGAGPLVMAFLAGPFYPLGHRAWPTAAAASHAREGILLVAVGDYLERSQMVLIELANADPKSALDISAEQERAHGLVSETRLYRQTAAHTGDAAVAGVLDQLERVLLDITHEPSRISPEALEKLRDRLKNEGILFKIRVLGSNVRREEEPAEPATRQRL